MTASSKEWDRRFFNLAYSVSCWSKDPNKQVGAVLVSPDRRQIAVGYNGLPRGTNLDNQLHELSKEEKNELTIHAEVNAILNAAVDIKGWTLYCTHPPCISCAIVIIQKQLARVVCSPPIQSSQWYESNLKARGLLLTSHVRMSYNGDFD